MKDIAAAITTPSTEVMVSREIGYNARQAL